jgi:hypothetical protein
MEQTDMDDNIDIKFIPIKRARIGNNIDRTRQTNKKNKCVTN